MTLLSICIPTRNRCQLLQRAVASLLPLPGQVEIIISDNQSSDGTEQLRFSYPAVTIIRQDKLIGMAENWNACLRLAKGDFVLVLSDDDYVDQGFLPLVLNRLKVASDATGLFVTSHLQVIFDHPNLGTQVDVGQTFHGEESVSSEAFAQACLQGFHPQLCSIIFRRSLLSEGFNSSFVYAIDVEALLRTAALADRIGIIGEAVAVYTISQINASWTINLAEKIREEVAITRTMAYILNRAGGSRSRLTRHVLHRLWRQARYLARSRHSLLLGILWKMLWYLCFANAKRL